MNWKRKRKWILALMMIVMASLLNPLPVWAGTMNADPDTVTEQEGFDQEFTLTLTGDEFQSSVSSEHVELGGDFQFHSVTDTVYSDSTTVTTRVYGDLYSDNGTGTIKIYGDALVGGSDITATITVDPTGSTGGSGTVEDPYQISDASQLNMVRHELNAHYKLVNDINLGVGSYKEGEGWLPIGTVGDPFTGGFDGNGYTISNLYINRSNTDYVGLFGAFQAAVIKNVRLEDVNVTGNYRVGGLVGYKNNGTISNSHATGAVKGNEKVGGLVGDIYRGTITNSYATADVEGSKSVGGLVGYSDYSQITNSYATGNVEGNNHDYVGGLVGYSDYNQITNSYAAGNVTSIGSFDGGLVGYLKESFIENSYATGNVEGNNHDYVGGLVGDKTGGTITNSHATGTVKGNSEVGGLVGYNSGNIINSFFNRQTTGQDNGVGYGSADGVTDLTTDQMKEQDSFDEWDFPTVWQIDENTTYPYLAWQNDNKDFAPPVFADGYPQAENVTHNGLDLLVKVDEDATAYYMVVLKGTDISAEGEYTPVQYGDFPLNGGIDKTEAITGLDPETAYDIYVGAEDTAGNPQPDVLTAKVEVTTQAASLPEMGGTVTIGGEAKYGETLTADISGITYAPATNEDEPSYQWKRGGTEITGATTSTYSLVEADIGKNITITVTADGIHATGSVTSAATAAVAKADGPETPAAPVLESKTHSTVTLEANAACEFSADGEVWQDSNVFTGLSPQTEYTFTARVKETATHKPSAESDGLSVTTEEEPVESDITPPDVTDKTISTSGLTDTGVTLSWNKATDNVIDPSALQYLVYRSDTGNIDTVENIEANGTAEGTYEADIDTKEITGLTGGTTYYFNVIVKDEAGNKAAYTMQEVTTSAERRSGGGGGGSRSTDPSGSASKFIRGDTGGSVNFGNATVEVPAGTLPAGATFKVERLTEREAEDLIPSGLRVKTGSDIYDITTSGDRDFGDNTITIKIAYDPDRIGDGEEPVTHYYDEETGEWTFLETTVEQGADGKWYAVVEVNHLTKFAVFSAEAEEEDEAEVEEEAAVTRAPKDIVLTLDQKTATVDGSQYTLDAAPYIDTAANRTLVPIRFVSETLEASVDWNAETRQVIFKDGEKEIVLTIGSKNVLIDGQTTVIDSAPATIPPGRTFVPLRFVSENLGAQVDWDAATREIAITR